MSSNPLQCIKTKSNLSTAISATLNGKRLVNFCSFTAALIQVKFTDEIDFFCK